MKLIAVLIFCLYPFTSYAEITVKDYKKMKSSSEMTQYLSAVGTGFGWANTELELQKRQPLFCQTRVMSLNSQNYLELLNAELADIESQSTGVNKAYLDLPVELFLMKKLIKTFPCK
ncbi:hypothetical protein [Polynucleobacter brandtiae]|uniref:Rap1a immunity protein domain-containing protein n=1 Tax=Polynucleobacter brandtiae TaxID=1938816 RepID=A0A2M8VZ08_9BURK|nr:hypothetical protein [Polynucleobacter brandtiae]PJI83075.1 hypothetical protein B0G85_0466 [Polynucleobacter brandtiae]